jgi:hypothetical protein
MAGPLRRMWSATLGQYFIPPEDEDALPTVGMHVGGAMFDPETQALENARAGVEQERLDARNAARRAEFEQDLARFHADEQSMERYRNEELRHLLPQHLRGSVPDDD